MVEKKSSKEGGGDEPLSNEQQSRISSSQQEQLEDADDRLPVISRPSFASSVASSITNSQAWLMRDEEVGQDPDETAQLRKQRQQQRRGNQVPSSPTPQPPHLHHRRQQITQELRRQEGKPPVLPRAPRQDDDSVIDDGALPKERQLPPVVPVPVPQTSARDSTDASTTSAAVSMVPLTRTENVQSQAGQQSRPGAYSMAPQTQTNSASGNAETPSATRNNNSGEHDNLWESQHNPNNSSTGQQAQVTTLSPQDNTTPIAEAVDEKELRSQILQEIAQSTLTATQVETAHASNEDEESDSKRNDSSRSGKKKLWLIIGGVLLLLGIGGVVGGIVASQSSGGSADSEPDTDSSDASTIDRGDLTPTISPAPTLSPTTLAPTTLADRILNLFADFSGLDVLQQNDTPQWQAYQWITADPMLAILSDLQLLQRYALATLYFATDGGRWDTVEFLLSTSYCDWDGVACTGQVEDSSVEVSALHLTALGLSGPLPLEIGLLTSLTVLDLADNSITGSLPSTIGLLTNIQELNMPGRSTSSLPPSQRSRSLQQQANNLSGALPSEVGSLTALQRMNLQGNSLSGSIPTQIGKLLNLQELNLSDNQFQGDIPVQLGFLERMRILNLDRNPSLKGFIPNSFCSSRSEIEELSSDCAPEGSTGQPLVVCKCCNICCSSTGICTNVDVTPSPSAVPSAAPSSLPTPSPSASPSAAPSVAPSQGPTQAPSAIPTMSPTTPAPTPPPTTPRPTEAPTIFETAAPTDLYDILYDFVNGVSFTWELDDPFSPQYEALEWLVEDVTNDSLWWDDYDLMQRYVLAVLHFSTNPESWVRNNFLTVNHVCDWNRGNNNIVLCDVNDRVTGIDADGSRMDGTIPHELSVLTDLTYLALGGNFNFGTIPTELGRLTNLEYLSLSRAFFTGTVPSELGLLTALTRLTMYDNELWGTIPEELANPPNLVEFHVDKNEFWGEVPYDFCLRDMNEMDADCISSYGNWPEIECFCCTTCYDEDGVGFGCYDENGVYYCDPSYEGTSIWDDGDDGDGTTDGTDDGGSWQTENPSYGNTDGGWETSPPTF